MSRSLSSSRLRFFFAGIVPFLRDESTLNPKPENTNNIRPLSQPPINSAPPVGGLPTLIRFDGGDVCKEIQRVEGALTKDQIIEFVNGDFRR